MIARQTIFSPDRKHRYTLWREWSMEHVPGATADDDNYVMFIALNPSTADEVKNDNTVRRCIDYAKRWGFNSMCMTNIFAWRDTDPEGMKKVSDPIGPDNDYWLTQIANSAKIVVAAWGNHGKFLSRGDQVRKLITRLYCLKLTSAGEPWHPLYLKKTLQPKPL